MTRLKHRLFLIAILTISLIAFDLAFLRGKIRTEVKEDASHGLERAEHYIKQDLSPHQLRGRLESKQNLWNVR